MIFAAVALVCALAATEEARTYHPVEITDLAQGRVRRTHVEVSGFVTYQKMEADGDRHVRLCDSARVVGMNKRRCVVLECVPEMPCTAPPRGVKVWARGITRYDAESGHQWYEVHPLEERSW